MVLIFFIVLLDHVDGAASDMAFSLQRVLVGLVPCNNIKDLLRLRDVFSPLAIFIGDAQINVIHQQHLAYLEMVSLSGQMQTTASYRMIIVQIRLLILQQHYVALVRSLLIDP